VFPLLDGVVKSGLRSVVAILEVKNGVFLIIGTA